MKKKPTFSVHLRAHHTPDRAIIHTAEPLSAGDAIAIAANEARCSAADEERRWREPSSQHRTLIYSEAYRDDLRGAPYYGAVASVISSLPVSR